MKDIIPPNDEHIRPDGVSDETISALGKVSEATEWVERARGHLFELHQLIGRADLTFGEVADMLVAAGHNQLAETLRTEIIGRNILPGRWTFQIVEEFDDGYYAAVKSYDQQVRDSLVKGRRHIFESEMKESRRSHGQPGHKARP